MRWTDTSILLLLTEAWQTVWRLLTARARSLRRNQLGQVDCCNERGNVIYSEWDSHLIFSGRAVGSQVLSNLGEIANTCHDPPPSSAEGGTLDNILVFSNWQQDDLPNETSNETSGGRLQDHDHKFKLDRWRHRAVHAWQLAVDGINEAVDDRLFPLKQHLQFVQQQGL